MSTKLPAALMAAFLLCQGLLSSQEPSYILLEAEQMEGSWGQGMAFGASGSARAADGSALTKKIVLPAGSYTVYIRAVSSLTQQATYRVEIGSQAIDTPPQGPPHSREYRIGWIRAGKATAPGGEVTLLIKDGVKDGQEVLDAIALAGESFSDRAGRALALNEYVLRKVEQASAPTAPPKSADEARQRQAVLRKRLLGMMGLEPMPARTPLNPLITGTIDRGDYVIEKIAFESRPKHVVPALLYRPKRVDGRLPAVVGVIGHWNAGKSSEYPQLRGIALARQGYIAFHFDPSYAWERKIPGNSEASDPFLSGAAIQGHMAWDTMRAVDYLTTRGDVDPERIALTGASGGGQQTLYAGAIDDRIKVVAPAVYVWAFKDITAHWGYSFDNWLPGVLRNGDMGATLALIAPRALLVLAVTEDYVNLEGSRRQVEIAKPYFDALGAGEKIKFSVHPGEHSYDKPLREALYGFLDKWLKGIGDGSPHPEPKLDPFPEKATELLVFPDGKIPTDGAATVRSIWFEEALRRRNALPTGNSKMASMLRDEVLRLPKNERLRVSGAQPRLLLTTEAGIEVPALLKGSGERAVVWVSEQDVEEEAKSKAVENLARRYTVLVVEPRSLGMPADRLLANQAAIMLGTPLVGMWTYDVLRAVDYMFSRPGTKSVSIAGSGTYAGLAGLFAAVLNPRIERAAIDGVFASFLTVLGRNPIAEIPGMLRVADIDQLVAAAGNRVALNRLQAAPVEVEIKVKGAERDLSEFVEQAFK